MKLSSAIVATSLVIDICSAHFLVTQIQSGGIWSPVGYGVRLANPNPVLNYSTEDIVCRSAPRTAGQVIDVAAGSTVRVQWRPTVSAGPGSDLLPSHKGPTLAYLRKINNAATDVAVGDGFFKIAENGYDSATKQWAWDLVRAADGVDSLVIPKCVPEGQYILRLENIALHEAFKSFTAGNIGAQFYPSCAQIRVVGSTNVKTPSTVAFPGAYKSTTPGIVFDIYASSFTYPIPGPPVFKC